MTSLIGSLLSIAIFAAGGLTMTTIILTTLVTTAFSVLGSLIARKGIKKDDDNFEPTQFTRREIGGTTPIVVGRRRAYGIEVYRKNDTITAGASSQQFFEIIYSIGPISFLSDFEAWGERNIWDLGFAGSSYSSYSSIIDIHLGKIDQTQTGFGWWDIAGKRSDVYTKYDPLGLRITPNAPHPVAYIGRAGANIFLAADEQGRAAGMNVAISALVDGMLCRRFKNADGDYLCHVGDHNKYAEFYYDETRYTGVVTAGNYTAAQLATAVQSALNAAFDDDGAGHAITFTVSYSSETGKFTISSNMADVILLTWTGSHRGADIWDDLGLLRGARYDMNPATEDGNDFDDLQLAGTGPYTITSEYTFEKSFSRNPIRIIFELRTNNMTSKGIEHPDDFDQSLMYDEEKYCNGIVEVDGETQYDISPRNIVPMLRRVYIGADVISGTAAEPGELRLLSDQSYADAIERIKDSGTTIYIPVAGAPSPETITPGIIIYLATGGKIPYNIAYITIENKSGIAQTYTVETTAEPSELLYLEQDGQPLYGWRETAWDTQGTITASTNPSDTINLPLNSNIYGIRIINFSAASGDFRIDRLSVGDRNVAEYSEVGLFKVNSAPSIPGYIRHMLFDNDCYVTFTTAPGLELSGPENGAYIEIRFPFKRTIGMVALYTNTGLTQSYNIYYQADTGGAWTLLYEQDDMKGNDNAVFEPTEMIALRISDMNYGGGAFRLTEIEVFDAIPSRRYTLDAINEDGSQSTEFLAKLYESFFAIPCDMNGYRFVRVERDEPPVQEINERHLISVTKKSTPRRERINQWILKFPNELKNYDNDTIVMDDYPAQIKTYQFPGGGTGNVMQPAEIDFVGVTRPAQMWRMGTILKRRARYADKFYTATIRSGALAAKVGDIIRLNAPSRRISNKLVRLVRVSVQPNFEYEVEGYEHHADVYDDAAIPIEDISFEADATSSGIGSVMPGDVYSIVLSIVMPDISGISVPMVKVQYQKPDDPNWAYANIWVNWNAETNDDGNRVYKLESPRAMGDGGFGFPLDAADAVDNLLTLRIIVQSVSKTEAKRSIYQIEGAWEIGASHAVAELAIPLEDGQPLIAAIIGAVATQSIKSYKKFNGDGQTGLFELGSPYIAETIEVYIDGFRVDRHVVGENDDTDEWVNKYFEKSPLDGEISLLYAPPNGSSISIWYVKTSESWFD